jgi:DNA-binding SARP family transcriptional activator
MGTQGHVVLGAHQEAGLQGDDPRLALLGGFEINVDGNKVHLPLGAQRLLALLALQQQSGGMHRTTAAERLWPDSTVRRAAANLRSALWQGRCAGEREIIVADGSRLQLNPAVRVDFREVVEIARKAIANANGSEGEYESWYEAVITALSRELLPDWSDDWIILDRERWDQVRLHTLESLAQQLMCAECYLPATEAAYAAVAIEPVRESAHRTVIEIFIAQDNAACAVKHYHRYCQLIKNELGVAPSRRMTCLVQSIRSP